MIFGTRLKRKQKKYARERTSSLEWHGGLGGFQTAIYLEGYMDGIHSKNEVCMLHATITVRFRELALACSWLHYHAHQQLHSICFTWKANGKIFFYYIHFLFVIFLYIYLTDNIFMLQVMVHGREPSPMEFLLKQMCGVMTAKKGCKSSWIVELSTFWYVGFQPFFY
jgi:hypothetical protein